MRPWFLRIGLAICALTLVEIGLLCFPQPLFPYRLSRGNMTLHSDRPLPPEAATLLDEARARLARSPWDNPRLIHRLFICQTRWRWRLASLHKHGVGGFNCVYFNRNTFLREVDWSKGRLIGPSGKAVEGERDLPYYFAHEAAHGITVARIGRWRYFRAASWKKEGYADYVGKARFDFDAYLEKLRAGDPRLDPASGYYWRYLLLVGHLLERRRVDVDSLFRSEWDPGRLEAELTRAQ